MVKISTKFGPKPILVLLLNDDFVRKYDLQLLVNDVAIHETFILNSKSKKLTKFPFLFPPNKANYKKPYLKDFIGLFDSIIKQYNLENHEDNLLFLSNTYYQAATLKSKDDYKSTVLNERGRVLYELIKAPIPLYNIDTIHEAFSEDALLDNGSESLLKLYLNVVTKMPQSHFENSDGTLNKEIISQEIEYKLIEKVLADNNTSFQMENGKYLIVSKAANLSLNYLNSLGKRTYVEPSDKFQNQDLCLLIVKHLLKEQHDANTTFYQALLNFDFVKRCKISDLIKTLGHWHSIGHNAYYIIKVYDTILNYLIDNELIIGSNKALTKLKRDNFLMQYLILMNFLSVDSIKSKSPATIADLKENLSAFKEKHRINPKFASEKFDEFLKNLYR